MKKILFILSGIFFVSVANATVLDTCLAKIEKNDELWQNMLFDKTKGVFGTLGDNDELTDDIVQSHKPKIYTLIASNILLNCRDDMVNIARIPRGQINFSHNNKDYAFDFSTETLFDYIDIRTGFVVINKKNLKAGDVLELSDIQENQHFFPDECSDHRVRLNLDNKAAVNKAGQAVFVEFGGTKHEFFLDFPVGKGRRAFPGLVLMDKSGLGGSEHIVSYRNLRVGLERLKQFGSKLKTTSCGNQGLAVYLVALDVKKDSNSDKQVWLLAFVPGFIIALTPSKIEDIQQVMILDGPYIL